MHDSLEGLEPGSAKRRQILEGARLVFSECGFERASVNEIALRAGVSKATLYNHFPDKEGIFKACIEDHCSNFAEQIRTCLVTSQGSIEADLQMVGQRHISVVSSPEAVGFFRIVIAESMRQPTLSRQLYQSGPKYITEQLAGLIADAGRRGELDVDDPITAAHQFFALCQADLALRLYLSMDARITEVEAEMCVKKAVRTFMRAYAPAAPKNR